MLRNWILQDLPHVLTPKSLQTLATVRVHTTPTTSRKFWNLFEFSRKDNRKEVQKLPKQRKERDALNKPKSNKLCDTSKSMVAMTSSTEPASSNDYTFRYIPRIKPKKKTSRTNINKPDELNSLLDGNLVPTNMKLKLKGYKTLRNEHAKDFAFVPGGKCFELDILPSKDEENPPEESYKLSKPLASKKIEQLQKQSYQEAACYDEFESHPYIPFPTPTSKYSSFVENKISTNEAKPDSPTKIETKEAHQPQDNLAINTQKQSEATAELKDTTLVQQKEPGKSGVLRSQSQDKFQTRLASEQKEHEKIVASKDDTSQVQQSQKNDLQQESQSLSAENVKLPSPETVSATAQSPEHSTNSFSDLSHQNKDKPSTPTSLNQPKSQDKVSESRDIAKSSRTSPYVFIKRMGLGRTSHDQSCDSSVKNTAKDNPSEATEPEIKSHTKIPRYSMYESRMDQQRRASSPCSTSFVKVRQNSTKQRWSGFDGQATGCYPRSSGSHGTGSQGSTRPYPPTVPTREASSKCYARERDPIIRLNIAGSRKVVKTRNSVTAASIATVNFAEASTAIKGDRVLLGSKSTTAFINTSQTVAYGSCNKSNSNCNEKSACPKKRRSDCDEMIPGKVICTKPRRRNDCPRPKPCKMEKPCPKKPTCPEPQPPPRPICTKPKKKKTCKRYCCPALQEEECLLKRRACPTKRGKKCNNNTDNYDEHDDNDGCYQPMMSNKDPTCMPMKDPARETRNDCNDDDNNNAVQCDNCGVLPRDMCNSPSRCNRNRCSNKERDDDCLENDNEYREICTKPKRKECGNSRRNSRRSNSCGNRRYHSETKTLRSSKSFVTIPIFDVSIVSFRPYQNDAVLRFYSSDNGCKPPGPCPEPDPCGKPKPDHCKKKPGPDDERVQKELKEMRKCKGLDKEDKCAKKKSGLERVVSPCKKNHKKKCDKFEAIDDLEDVNRGLRASTVKLDDPLINFLTRRGYDSSSLLNFGMKPGNIIVNRSSCTMAKIDSRRKSNLQDSDIYKEELPLLVEAEPVEKEWDEESSSSER
ncbi:hypothetical protein KPH14_012541 [Odynerus spinipes]|uniref:Uncharacterized protein n=1 Tax=Odynerus spinipes TaxID=1348599 RepID=A0AAD9RIB5_9HYME|nr:hypothetical protein KPH14_012541 [Odynerus spinipes]